TTDRDDIARQRHPARHERAFTKEYTVADARAGHQYRRIADLAEVADGCADDHAAVTEHRSSPDANRDRGRADHDGVLEHRRAGSDLDVRVDGADDRTLCEQHTFAHAHTTEHDHGVREVRETEAHVSANRRSISIPMILHSVAGWS